MTANCSHDLAALRDHLCCDCIIEALYHHRVKSLQEIMKGGPLNVWTN